MLFISNTPDSTLSLVFMISSPSSLTTTTSPVGSMLKTNSRYDISMFHSISATRAYTLGISDRLIGLIPYRIPCAFLLWLKKKINCRNNPLIRRIPSLDNICSYMYIVVYIFKGNIEFRQFKILNKRLLFFLHIYYNSLRNIVLHSTVK